MKFSSIIGAATIWLLSAWVMVLYALDPALRTLVSWQLLVLGLAAYYSGVCLVYAGSILFQPPEPSAVTEAVVTAAVGEIVVRPTTTSPRQPAPPEAPVVGIRRILEDNEAA